MSSFLFFPYVSFSLKCSEICAAEIAAVTARHLKPTIFGAYNYIVQGVVSVCGLANAEPINYVVVFLH